MSGRLVQGELNGGRFEVADDHLEVSFAHARMVDVDLSGLKFSSFLAHDSVFERCDFSRATLENVSFGAAGYGDQVLKKRTWPMTVYRECVFSRTRLAAHAAFGNARFERCVFDAVRLRDQTSTYQAQFVECTFRGRIQTVNFWGRQTGPDTGLGRDLNDFTGNDFTGAELIGVAFKYIDLRAQQFPGLPGYAVLDRIDERVAAALAAIAGWPDQKIKANAAATMRFKAIEANEYNDGEALVSRDWVGRRLRADVRDHLFWVLVNHTFDKP